MHIHVHFTGMTTQSLKQHTGAAAAVDNSGSDDVTAVGSGVAGIPGGGAGHAGCGGGGEAASALIEGGGGGEC